MTHSAGRPPHPGPHVPDLTPGSELRRLMRAWRHRLDTAAGRRPSPARRWVTQDALARRLGVTATWYRNLEHGIQAGYSQTFLDKVAHVLHLDSHERQVLYLLATGRAPAARPVSPVDAISDALADLIHGLPYPAYIIDEAWDIHLRNHAMDNWFPQLHRVNNIMRLIFCVPDTRRQLVDFEHDWAPSLVGQLRGALARWPNNARLIQLVTNILATDDHARRLWHQPVVRVHADGERRHLHPARSTHPHHIEIITVSLYRAENLRMIALKPVPEPAPTAPEP